MELLHTAARLSVDWMIYCLIEGSALAFLVWLISRLLPRQNAGTRFALWFSALLAMIVLPFFRGPWKSTAMASPDRVPARHGLITLPDSWAVYVFAAWASIAALALVRVGIGLWQIRKLRKSSQEIDPASQR